MTFPSFTAVALSTSLSFVVAGPVFAQGARPLRSVYWDIARKHCPDDFHLPLSQLDQDQPITYTCRVSKNLAIALRYRNSVAVTFRRRGDNPAGPQLIGDYDVGDKVEARGHGIGAKFVAEAAIIRLRMRDDAGGFSDVFGIVRFDAAAICPAALIDTHANGDANALARGTADTIAAGFACATDKLRVIGATTEAVQQALDRLN